MKLMECLDEDACSAMLSVALLPEGALGGGLSRGVCVGPLYLDDL